MSKTISVRITDSEFEKIQQNNNESGLNVNEFLKHAIAQSLEPITIREEKISSPKHEIENMKNIFKQFDDFSNTSKKEIAKITKQIQELSEMTFKQEPEKMKCFAKSDLDTHLEKLESIDNSCPFG